MGDATIDAGSARFGAPVANVGSMETNYPKSIERDTSTLEAEDLAYAGLKTKGGDRQRLALKVVAAGLALAAVLALAFYAYMTVLDQIAHLIVKARMDGATTNVMQLPPRLADTDPRVVTWGLRPPTI